MLWVGWFGFNAGSALTSGADAGMAMLVTHLAAAVASLTWMFIEWQRFGKPSLVGTVTGTIAGLATVTPASGFVGPMGAIIIGVVSGSLCYVAVQVVKQRFAVDDSLDVFGVHGVGGMTGTLLTAFLMPVALGGVGFAEDVTMMSQFVVQLIGVGSVAVWSGVASFVLIKLTQMVVGLRVRSRHRNPGSRSLGAWRDGLQCRLRRIFEMKMIIAIIQPYRVDAVREALTEVGVEGLTVSEVRGYGRQRGQKEIYRGAEYSVSYVPKLKLEIAVASEKADDVVEAITRAARTGKIGDGKIFVLPLDAVQRIRTGEVGVQAI